MKDKGIGTGATVGIIIVIIAIAAGGYYAYSQGGEGPGPENQPENQVEKEKIPIGIMMPLTGDLSPIAGPMRDGALLALEKVNEAGGLLDNQQINPVVEDTETSESAALDAASKLIDVNNVPVIVGPASSGMAQAILSTTISNEVVQIGPSNTAVVFTTWDDNGYYFRTCPSDALQGKAMANLAVDENYETAATLAINNPYGNGFANVFAEEFEKKGGTVQTQETFDPQATTFETVVSETAAENPDVIVLVAYHEKGSTILKQAYQQGVMEESDWLLAEGLKHDNLAEMTGKTAEGEFIIEGVKGTTPAPKSEYKYYDNYKADYKERYGSDPGIYSSNSYDAAAVAALAIQEAGEAKGSEIKKHIATVANPPGTKVFEIPKALSLLRQGEEINFQGASSALTFDNVGDITAATYEVWTIENGDVVHGRKLPV